MAPPKMAWLLALTSLGFGLFVAACGSSACSPCRPGTHASDTSHACSACIPNADGGEGAFDATSPDVDAGRPDATETAAETSTEAPNTDGGGEAPKADATDGGSEASKADAACQPGCAPMPLGSFCHADEVQWECRGSSFDPRTFSAASCRDPGTDLQRYCCPPSFLSTCQ